MLRGFYPIFYKNLSSLERIERELKKSIPCTHTLTSLVKKACIEKQVLSFSLFNANAPALLEALNTILNEPIFNTRFIHHASQTAYATSEKKLGEVHWCERSVFKKAENKNLSTTSFIEYTAIPVFSSFSKESVCQTSSFSVPEGLLNSTDPFVQNEFNKESYLVNKLISEGWVLSNASLIEHARSQLQNYYFKIANDHFKHFLEPLECRKALSAALHLSSENYFYHTFKILITEINFSDEKGDITPLTPLLTNYLQKSHLHPEATLELLGIEQERTLKSFKGITSCSL